MTAWLALFARCVVHVFCKFNLLAFLCECLCVSDKTKFTRIPSDLKYYDGFNSIMKLYRKRIQVIH